MRPGWTGTSSLVDALLEAGIEPWVTLYHWDLPQALQDRGGWPSRDVAYWFADYADLVSKRLGDRVKHWITHNEPWVAAFLGYQFGIHAPGQRDLGLALRAGHHLLVSHGLALEPLRANAGKDASLGITLNLYPIHPASDKGIDEEAARRPRRRTSTAGSWTRCCAARTRRTWSICSAGICPSRPRATWR